MNLIMVTIVVMCMVVVNLTVRVMLAVMLVVLVAVVESESKLTNSDGLNDVVTTPYAPSNVALRGRLVVGSALKLVAREGSSIRLILVHIIMASVMMMLTPTSVVATETVARFMVTRVKLIGNSGYVLWVLTMCLLITEAMVP